MNETTTIPKECWSITTGEVKPSIDCPDCSSILLGDDYPHEIRNDGVILPRVFCNTCGFNEYVQLKGWNGGEIK